VDDEAADSPANGVVGEVRATSEPQDGELQPKLTFEAAMAKEMSVDHPVGRGEAQTRGQVVLEFFPHV
jgi:hypothetical protein